MLKPSRLSWMILTIVLAMASLANAQNASTGAISGTITDPSGAVVPDAHVTVTNQATGTVRTASTTGSGRYDVPLLAPGNYKIEIARSGFKTETTSDVRVVVTETATVNMRLQVGTASETVTVQSAETQLQTESAELGSVTSGEQIENLPLVTRNYTQIIALNPAVSAEVNNASSLGRGSTSQGLGASGFSSQGGITNDNNFKMNGVEVDDLQGSGDTSAGLPIPNPDTLQEFKVVTGQYDASYGRNAGAQVNVLTKGGSNQIHGSLFEYLRNDALNANDWFRNRTNLKKPILKQNQFGGVLGGPIIKNKLFYFGSYQGTRQRNGIDSNCSSVVQTPALTNDRSAAALGALFAGKTGYLGVGPAIKADGSNINPIALKILQQKMPDGTYAIPTPQTVDPTQPFDIQGTSRYSIACPYTEDQYMGNGDFQQTDKMKWSARTFFANSLTTKTLPGPNAGSAALPGFPLTTPNKFRDVSLQNTYIFSSTLLNQIEIGYSRAVGSNTAASPFKFSDFGITVPDFDNGDPVIGIGAGFPNAPGFGGYGQNIGFVQNTYNVQDDLAWVRGRQTLRFGGGLTKWQNNEPGLIYPGTIYFLSFADFLLGLSGPQIGSPIGNVYTTVDLPGDKARAYRMTSANSYVQDDIKLTPKFTFNVGFRYERVGDVSEAKGRNTGFDFSLANTNPPASGTLQGYIVPANYTGDLPAGVTKIGNNYGIKGLGQNTWNPRVGFAYQIHRNVVLRGGYGLFHSRNTNNPLLQGVSAPPFSIARVNQLQAAAAASLANPFPYALPTLPAFLPYSPSSFITPFQGPDQNYKPPTFHRYSMDTQMELAKDLVLDLGYVGAHGSDLGRIIFPDAGLLATASNPVRGVTTTTVANLAQREPVPGIAVTGLLLYQSVGESWYHAFQSSLNKRFSHGLQFLASYTWARDLTTNPGAISASSGATRVFGDPNDLNSTYGPDPFIRPQRFVISYLYQLPQPANLHSFVGKVAGGWALTGVTVVQAGHPLYPTYSNGNNFTGVPYDRPDMVAGCNPTTSGSVQNRINSYFQYSCYAKPAIIGSDGKATAFGTAPIGNLIGPDQVNTDLAIIKKTTVPWPRETANVEYRAEMFNVFNHPEFADPSTTWSGNTASTAGGFGKITGMAVNPRIVQFALKYTF